MVGVRPVVELPSMAGGQERSFAGYQVDEIQLAREGVTGGPLEILRSGAVPVSLAFGLVVKYDLL